MADVDSIEDITEAEESCWCTITLLFTIIVALFSYRFFGPDTPNVNAPTEEHVEEVPKSPELKKPNDVEVSPLLIEDKAEEKCPEDKFNQSTGDSEKSSSGPEFEIINADDVPVMEDLQQTPEVSQVEVEETETTVPLKDSEISEKDIDILHAATEDVEDVPAVVTAVVTETAAATPTNDPTEEDDDDVEIVEDEIVPIDEPANLTRYEDEIMQGNFSDQTLVTPVKPANDEKTVSEDSLVAEHKPFNMELDNTIEDDSLLDSPVISPSKDTDTSEADMDIVDSAESIKAVPEKSTVEEEQTSESTDNTEASVAPSAPIVAQQEEEEEVENVRPVDVAATTTADEVAAGVTDVTEAELKTTAADLVEEAIGTVGDKIKNDIVDAQGDHWTEEDHIKEAEAKKQQLCEINELLKKSGEDVDAVEQAKLYVD